MHVTVVMASFNEESTIARAVESIRSQSYEDWDLVLVDDASDDGTSAIADQLATLDERIRVIHHERNLGLAASLNEAVQHARGELIARMDGDDVSMPDRFARQVQFLRDHPEVDVLGTAAEIVDAKGVVRGIARRPSRHDDLAIRFPRENPFIHPSVMARSHFYRETGGYDVRLRRAQDLDLWARGLERFRYANLSEPLVRYRIPGRPTVSSIAYGSFVIFRTGLRRGQPLRYGWFALRFLIAGVMTRVQLHNPWIR